MYFHIGVWNIGGVHLLCGRCKNMKHNNLPLIERDLSWLSFNHRVLQEAKDPTVPLLDRLKFMAIYSSNLEEFFRVRVAQIMNLLRVGRGTRKALAFDPDRLIKSIMKVVNQHQQELTTLFNKQLLPELRFNGIHILNPDMLNAEQLDFVDNYFKESLQAFIQPILLVDSKIKPFLNSGALYLYLHLLDRSKNKKKDHFAIVRVPSDQLPRFVILPEAKKGEHQVMILDDIVRLCVKFIFPGFILKDSYSIKLTRDSELYIDDETQGDLVAKIKKSLAKRNVGPASRLVYDRNMPGTMLNLLKRTFDMQDVDVIPEGKYHNNFDFFKLPDFGKKYLKEPSLPPLPYPALEESEDLFGEIRKRDHMIHVPYHQYESVIRFFEEASKDPAVTHIKVVQYRVARESRIMEALIDAAREGKKVSVFIEVKARFDEEANLRWGEKLEKAGVMVKYSFPELKVHSKIAWIRRMENKTAKQYAYLSTGNFNEDTALIYSDLGLFTGDGRLTNEVKKIFDYLESGRIPTAPFKHLLVGKNNLREELSNLLDFEIKQAKAGKPAEIIIKLNSLEDKDIIRRLYQCSRAGVKVKLIIRGICCIQPSRKKLSENIEAISIVDRYLEHARIFLFHHAGRDKIYCSSADWMERNLSFRIETAFPVYDPKIREQIKYLLYLQWKDNVKARDLAHQNTNPYRRNGSAISVRSQLETYSFFKNSIK